MYKLPPSYDDRFFYGTETGEYAASGYSQETLRQLARKTCNVCWGKGFHTVSLNRDKFWNGVCKCVHNKLDKMSNPPPARTKEEFMEKYVSHVA